MDLRNGNINRSDSLFLRMSQNNPFRSVPRFAEVREDRGVPTLEDFWIVYEVSTTNQDKLMLFMYMQTEASKDELFRLKWADVDLKSTESGSCGARIQLGSGKNLGCLSAKTWLRCWVTFQAHLTVTFISDHVQAY